jgi:hypothetical protein
LYRLSLPSAFRGFDYHALSLPQKDRQATSVRKWSRATTRAATPTAASGASALEGAVVPSPGDRLAAARTLGR